MNWPTTRRQRSEVQNSNRPRLLLAAASSGLLAFTVLPVVASFWFSLCNYPILDPALLRRRWRTMLSLRRTVRSGTRYGNTFEYVVHGGAVLGMVVGLGLALLAQTRR